MLLKCWHQIVALATATPKRAAVLRYGGTVLVAIVTMMILPRNSLGNNGGVVAFIVMAACAWRVGPGPALLGPLALMLTGQFQSMGVVRLQDISVHNWSNCFVITVVMVTVGWSGTLRRRSHALAKHRTDQLREQDRRKDEFLATLAHELRNPLAPIRTGLELLRVAGNDPLDAAMVRDVHGMLQRQIEHMVRLIDDLLDVSRINTGKIELRCRPVALADIMRVAVEASRPLVDAARHELIVTVPDQPIVIHADPERLAQVVTNLLNNATKFTEPGGRITLWAARCERTAEIHIRDTGVGISRELLPRVFEMFVQAENSLIRAHGGLGIGLALVRSLVQMHGGTVEVLSDGPGTGSEFILRLPLSADSQALHVGIEPPAATPDHRECRRRILIVDDNVDAGRSLGFLLRAEGHECRTVADGPTAFKIAADFLPDVFLLDIGMPGMNL